MFRVMTAGLPIWPNKTGFEVTIRRTQEAFTFPRPEKFALCDFISFNHRINWNQNAILEAENDYLKRLFAENWLINKKLLVMNKNDGKTLPFVDKKLIRP